MQSKITLSQTSLSSVKNVKVYTDSDSNKTLGDEDFRLNNEGNGGQSNSIDGSDYTDKWMV
jgi:hypothetical protein